MRIDIYILINFTNKTGFTFRELRERNRNCAIAEVRHNLFYQTCIETDLTFTEIGRIFDRTPATISYAFQKIANQA